MALVDDSSVFMIDEVYEFSAPRFFDFINGETETDMRKAELWFDTALGCAPSPFMPRIRTSRSVQLESLCDFSEIEQSQKAPPESETLNEGKGEVRSSIVNLVSADEKTLEAKDVLCSNDSGRITTGEASCNVKVELPNVESTSTTEETSTPKLTAVSRKGNHIAKKISSVVRNPSALQSHNRSQLSQANSTKPASARRETNLKNTVSTPNFAQENQPIKRQKLEGGKSKQILSFKTQFLPHKSRPGVCSSSNMCPSIAKTRKEDRKIYVREPAAPFVSTAEIVKKFQSNTKEMSLPHKSSSLSHAFFEIHYWVVQIRR